MNILGISAYFHDSAAALIRDGEIVAAAEEERFSRKKHDSSFPERAVDYCLSLLKDSEELDAIVYYEKPFLKFDRLFDTYLDFAPRGFRSFIHSFPLWTKEKLFLKQILKRKFKKKLKKEVDLYFSAHHLSHAASCFYPSPFEEASVLCLDGVGEWETTTLWHAKGKHIAPLKSLNFPHSIGLLYSTVTAYLGFKPNSDEYKVMGLAPYGDARFVETFKRELVDIKKDGSFRLNLEYFDYCTGLKMYNKGFEKLWGQKARRPEEKIDSFHCDMAASLQVLCEEIIFKLVEHLVATTGCRQLCLAGGVALNCVANGKILQRNLADQVWIQPAAGDSGGALGAALWLHHQVLCPNDKRDVVLPDAQKGSLLGPSFSNVEIKKTLDLQERSYREFSSWEELCESVAELLESGQVGGLFQGRMEFGPRALGSRSIIADARRADGQKYINQKIKFREDFRPFAPIVMREDLQNYFDFNHESPYMLLVGQVALDKRRGLSAKELAKTGLNQLGVYRSQIPAVTHVDYSARIQTVGEDRHPALYQLMKAYKKKTTESVLVNTSFNVKGEPIVCTPEEALNCFDHTGLDFLILENHLLIKDRSDES